MTVKEQHERPNTSPLCGSKTMAYSNKGYREDNSHLLHDGEARVKIFEFEERAALDRM